MIENLEVGKSYWFINISWPTDLPIHVMVADIDKRVVMFDNFVGQEKYADINYIKYDLFDSYSEAVYVLIDYVKNYPQEHFLEQYKIEHLVNVYPEGWL